MSDRPPLAKIIMLQPQDRKLLAEADRMRPVGTPPWKPSIEHSPSTCESCGLNCWIGPQQLAMSRSPFMRTKRLCVFCTAQADVSLGLDMDTIELNPEEPKIPRRG